MALITLGLVPGAASSGIIAGNIFDQYFSYKYVIYYLGSVQLVASFFCLAMIPPKRKIKGKEVPLKKADGHHIQPINDESNQVTISLNPEPSFQDSPNSASNDEKHGMV